jgi:uncharacterized membrane protein
MIEIYGLYVLMVILWIIVMIGLYILDTKLDRIEKRLEGFNEN